MPKRKQQEEFNSQMAASSSFHRKQETSKWNLKKIMSLFLMDPKELFENLVQADLIGPTRSCDKCGSEMKIIFLSDFAAESQKQRDKMYWICQRPCRKRVSFRTGTWFEGSKLSVPEILGFTYMWWHRYPLRLIKEEMEICDGTLANWANYCREVSVMVVCHGVGNFNCKIGGPNVDVEIGESVFGDAKRRVGSQRPDPLIGQWVIGGVERGTGKCFLAAVDDRSEETIRQVIEKWVEKGSTIYTDKRASYEFLGQTSDYRHMNVDHTENWVDPLTGAHTQTLQGLWRITKDSMPTTGRRSDFVGYLATVILQRALKDHPDKGFKEFLRLVGSVYSITPLTRALRIEAASNSEQIDGY